MNFVRHLIKTKNLIHKPHWRKHPIVHHWQESEIQENHQSSLPEVQDMTLKHKYMYVVDRVHMQVKVYYIPEFLDQQQHTVSAIDHQRREKLQELLQLSKSLFNVDI